MMYKCGIENCDTKPRDEKKYCYKHKNHDDLHECGSIKKNGEKCKNLTLKLYCKYHIGTRNMINKCDYVGVTMGKCDKPCRKKRCAEHNEKLIIQRREMSKLNMRKKNIEKKEEHKKLIENLEEKEKIIIEMEEILVENNIPFISHITCDIICTPSPA